MLGGLDVIGGIDVVVRETMLFAAVGLAAGGLDDLAIDLIYLARLVWRRTFRRSVPVPTVADFPGDEATGRIVVFVAAWDESAVIGAMLSAALARFDHPDYAIYVGTYPNDRPTVDAVAAVAERDARIRLVIGEDDGPTTKAGCLNAVWRAMLRDEAAGATPAKAVVLHDAEDVVHPAELAIIDRLIDRHWVVQLPVLPLVDRRSRLISGHYCDEFAEAHVKQMVVRGILGAGLPLAGTGCGIARDALAVIAARRDGEPFDATSLTEDYELGLGIDAIGGRGIFARVAEVPGGPVVAVRAFFPGTLTAAVRQKARWMVGIALAGWDRVGWGAIADWREHWMRMRDRRAPLAVLVLCAAYAALVAWGFASLLHWISGVPVPPTPRRLQVLLIGNGLLLAWRLVLRTWCTAQAYGWREARWAPPRVLVGNFIALLAARRALTRYVAMLRGAETRWDKTAHVFPEDLATALES
ncbi:MAG: glycosyl transferase family protein [Sphingomonas sp.]